MSQKKLSWKQQSGKNRRDAIAKDRNWYESTTPCKKCDSKIKYVSGYKCKPCSIEDGLVKLANTALMAPYRTQEKANAKQRRWRAENYNKWQAQWLRRPKDKACARGAKYRASKRNQTPDDADLDDIQAIYTRCQELSEETGIPHHVDHIHPISKGGLHHQDNLQILTAHDNQVKGNRIPENEEEKK